MAEKGHFELEMLADVTAGVPYYEEDLPVRIPLDHTVRGDINLINDTDESYRAHWKAYFIDPSKTVRGLAEDDYAIGSGETLHLNTEHVSLDKKGTWVLKGEAKFHRSEGSSQMEKSFVFSANPGEKLPIEKKWKAIKAGPPPTWKNYLPLILIGSGVGIAGTIYAVKKGK